MPGVKALSLSDGGVPLQGADDLSFWLEGHPKPTTPSEMKGAIVYRVEPGYLEAMGIRLSEADSLQSNDERSPNVVVIDEALARKYSAIPIYWQAILQAADPNLPRASMRRRL